MNNRLIIFALAFSMPGILFPGNKPPKPSKPMAESNPTDFALGFCSTQLKETVQVAATAISPEQLEKSGEALTKGLLAGMSDEEVYSKGYKLAEGAVMGAAGAGGALVKAAPATAAKVATAVIAAPATPWILGGGAIVAFVGYGYNIECQKEYGHCLRTHFDSPSVDDEKMPRRCNSPQRRAFRWGTNWAGQQKRIFKILKEEGRRPRPAVPGAPYWRAEGPNVMGKDDLEQREDK